MLQGPWPRMSEAGASIADLEAEVAAELLAPARLEAAIEELVAEVVGVQAAAGLDLVTDGQVRWPDPGAAVLAALARRGHRRRRPAGAHVARDGRAVRPGHRPGDPGAVLAGTARARDAWTPSGGRSSPTSWRTAWRASWRRWRRPAARWCWSRSPRRSASAATRTRMPTRPSARCSCRRQARLLAGRVGAARHARDRGRLGLGGRRPDDPGRPVPVLPVRPDRRPGQLVPRAGRARRSRRRLRLRCAPRASPTRRRSSCGRPATRPRPTAAARSGSGSPTGRRSSARIPRRVRRAVDALVRATRLAPLPPEQAVAEGLDPRTFRNPSDPPVGRRALAARARRRSAAERAPRNPCETGCSRRATVGLSSLRVAPGQASASRAPPRVATPDLDGGKEVSPVGELHVALEVNGEHREVDVEPTTPPRPGHPGRPRA